MPITAMMRGALAALLLVASGACASGGTSMNANNRGPASVADELLATDRAFSAASEKTDMISGLSAMFADDVTMPLPGGRFATGKSEAVDALKGNAENLTSKVVWTPVRAGISADGQQGFTYGYMKVTRASNAEVRGKYLAYWVKGPQGWRIAVYKRGLSPSDVPDLTLLPPAIPPAMVSPLSDAGVIAGFRASIDAVERSFSDESQAIGLGPAFAKYGTADAVNMGGPADREFTRGAEAIGRAVSGGAGSAPSPVSWAPDKVIVASSGDLGVTIGIIRQNVAPAGGQPGQYAFFTVWRRSSTSEPWRYVAE